MSQTNLDFENSSSPYYLHPSENPSLILVSPPLNGQNYHSWFRSMRMCLLSKNKLKFVDGSIQVPAVTDPMHPVWERCNTMVLSWILKSLSPSIAQSILWLDNAVDVWSDLFDRFSQRNAMRISDLQEEISAHKQNNLSVTEYFTQLKILWDEFVNLRMIPACVCTPQCHCDALKTVKVQQEGDYVIRFLKGLNESYFVVRTQILMLDPLPKINKAFSLALQHERQLTMGLTIPQNIEPTAFATQATVPYQRRPVFNNSNRGFRPSFSSSSGTGHSIDICFKKHGYPPGYRPRFRPQTFVNQVGEYVYPDDQYQDAYSFDRSQDSYDIGYYAAEEQNQNVNQAGQVGNTLVQNQTENVMAPVITQDQYTHLMALLQNQTSNSTERTTPKVNVISTNFDVVTQPEGTQLLSYFYFNNFVACSFGKKTGSLDWIIDSGATDHIVCSLNAFSSYKLVKNVFVTLPNHSKIPVTHIGIVKFSSSFVLHEVYAYRVKRINLEQIGEKLEKVPSSSKVPPDTIEELAQITICESFVANSSKVPPDTIEELARMYLRT
ncbi:uncharacterized protein LOC126661981 [Mercurialis annua]|uniref:uncharacterized protein LOC126661981 n=1 Tax=Mercurialis annua TaxID=3986 RepID=UPI00215F5341|nr:uncharacterized protein LOC126661981 [Mercurialis annua]